MSPVTVLIPTLLRPLVEDRSAVEVPLESTAPVSAVLDTLADGRLEVLGTQIDLSRITVPIFVTGAANDHLTPWPGCYRTTQLLSGPSTYVLSNAGHIASLVNPPGNPKASYWAGAEPGPDPAAWRDTADRRTGSWWEAWATWVLERSGVEVEAHAELGSDRHPALEPAPGSYVLDRVP